MQTVSKEQQETNVYSHFDVETQPSDCTVTTGDPDMLNPNSFVNISTILHTLGHRMGILGEEAHKNREWIFLECDGGIYSIVEKLIFNTLRCDACDKCFYGIEVLKKHDCFAEHNVSYQHHFDWIVPVPGLLHVEMNGARAFLKSTWVGFMSEITKVLSFTSPNAQQHIQGGKDHHCA